VVRLREHSHGYVVIIKVDVEALLETELKKALAQGKPA
jgi:hypothetical protein